MARPSVTHVGAVRRRLSPRIAAPLAAASCIAALGAAAALGHSGVESSTPRAGAVLARSPATVTIRFSGPVARIGTVRATRNGDGDLVKSARISPRDATRVVVRLKRPGPRKQAGSYRVAWRVTGADGHAVSGVIPFRVRR